MMFQQRSGKEILPTLAEWGFSKGFDKLAPLGPMIESHQVVGNARNLTLQSLVDGVIRPNSNTKDLLFGMEEIIEFISQGTLLEQSAVFMTGTPVGVAMGMKSPS